MDKIKSIKSRLNDLKCEYEELQYIGELEDILECSLEISRLEEELIKVQQEPKKEGE